MEAQNVIKHKVGYDIKAYVSGKCVATCFITGYCDDKTIIEYRTEDERLQKFVAHCESKYSTIFKIVTYTKYHLKFSDDNQWDIYASSDDEAIKICNNYFSTISGIVTQGDRFVGNIEGKRLPEFVIDRKTWKRRDYTQNIK